MNINEFRTLSAFPFIHNGNQYDGIKIAKNNTCKTCNNVDCCNQSNYLSNTKYICRKDLVSYIVKTNDQHIYFINGFVRPNARVTSTLLAYKRDYIEKEEAIIEFIRLVNIFNVLIEEKTKHSIEKNFSVFHDIRTTAITITRCTENLIKKQLGNTFEEKLYNNKDLLDLYDSITLLSDQFNMIDILVNTSKIQYTKKRQINVFQLCERISRLLRKNAATKEVKIQWHDNGKIEDCLLYPSISLLPLVLIDNAIKYSFSGRVIDIGIYDEQNNIKIVISSFGNFVPLEDRSIIFEKFQRGGNSKDKEGIGLGLWIAKQLLFAHEGDITYSTNGSGDAGQNVFTSIIPKLSNNIVA